MNIIVLLEFSSWIGFPPLGLRLEYYASNLVMVHASLPSPSHSLCRRLNLARLADLFHLLFTHRKRRRAVHPPKSNRTKRIKVLEKRRMRREGKRGNWASGIGTIRDRQRESEGDDTEPWLKGVSRRIVNESIAILAFYLQELWIE